MGPSLLAGTIRLIMLSAHLSTRPFIIPPPVYRYIDPLLTRVKLCRSLPSPFVLSHLLFVYEPRRKEGRKAVAENNRGGDRANDRRSLMNIVSARNAGIDRREISIFLFPSTVNS